MVVLGGGCGRTPFSCLGPRDGAVRLILTLVMSITGTAVPFLGSMITQLETKFAGHDSSSMSRSVDDVKPTLELYAEFIINSNSLIAELESMSFENRRGFLFRLALHDRQNPQLSMR